MTETRKFGENFYILDDGRVRQFLITGPKEALLIDTGFPDSGVYQAVKAITDKPVKVVLTHGDWDHTGGLGQFRECWLHPRDWHLVEGDVTLHPLQDGDVFTCGGYRLEVMEIPGHTYGSVAFFDRERKLLLPGDSVQKGGPIFMFGSHRNLDLYIESLRELRGLSGQVETILPCHHPCPIDFSYVEKNLEDAVALKKGALKGTKHPTLPCVSYRGRWTEFYYD
ncbi:MBL fold metallo-hydrolase [uncultured Pseudoflavonifractor sp.]|uniref:MBL fold metallo-hydrolase n=1 Tax=uncultured Pseudoflavonifractor sp. TaxID=1221379 RepID=UPI0025E27FCC|nr:MBL fold metallo-hydrolase [uncultured Pseudoflavonifractor sp.]